MPLPEWLVEQGIGETRAALVDDGRIVEARIELDGIVPAGTVVRARLTGIGGAGRNGTARDEDGTDYLLPAVPKGVTEGAQLNIEVTRPALEGPEPWKRPLARATANPERKALPLAERLRCGPDPVRVLTLPAATDELETAGWNDVLDEARSGRIAFPGGSLGLFLTPAMTLIDIDGTLPAAKLAVAGAEAAAKAIRRLDIGGSIGVDFPTVAGKEARAAAAGAIDEHLPQPFERTAVNGFGFLQIVRPRSRSSLLELASDRAAFEARALLRAAAFEGSGRKILVANPAIIAFLDVRDQWTGALSRQSGGAVTLRSERSLPIHGGYAEKS